MDRTDFEMLLSDEGRMIFLGFERLERENPNIIELKETDHGFHLCLKGSRDGQLIEFIQIWGDPMQKLETRFSMMESKMALPFETRDKIWDILRPAGFEKIDGTPRNMRLLFKKVNKPYSEGDLDFLLTRVMSAVALLEECPTKP